MASYNTELSRRGPGLMLADIAAGDDAQVAALAAVIARADPDILLLQGVDYDHDGAALNALADRLAAQGAPYAHRFARPPNSGQPSGADLDGDGQRHGPGDAQGFGHFPGQGGLALLSRYPVDPRAVRDFSSLLWADLPGATLPVLDGRPFPSAGAQSVQRLSNTAHWDVPVQVAGTVLHILAFHATPPVFDGPEDRNGLRNRDELRLWSLYLDGALPGAPAPAGPVVLMGDANLDPADGAGRHGAIAALLAHPRLQDPLPGSDGARQAGAGDGQRGEPAHDTVDWPEDGPGNLRVDYVLPDAAFRVLGAGVHWPADGPAAEEAARASRHRLVWVDIALP